MRTLLALFAAGGLVWVGTSENTPVAAQPKTEIPPPPPLLAPEQLAQPPAALQLPGGSPPPFAPGRPVVVRVPAGYEGVPAGDHYCQWTGKFWEGGADRYTFAFYVTRYETTPVSHSLALWYSHGGNVLYPGRTLSEPRAFCDQHAIAPDGTWIPSGTSYRFPAAAQPFLVFQP